MKIKSKKMLFMGVIFLSVFVIWTFLVRLIDVKNIGPNESSVGFAILNEFLHSRIGVNFTLYTITDWLGLVPIFICMIFGCIGFGDCQVACAFDALHIDPTTGLPVIDEDKCTACGACTKACPKLLLQLRKKGPKGRKVYVACKSQDKGAVAKKACQSACIGCSKCVKECPFEAITVQNNVAYIDDTKCRLCRKCVAVCPTGAIHAVNFPVKKDENV